MINFYRLYVAQILLTVSVLMLPPSVLRWIATGLLLLVMGVLWLVLSVSVRIATEAEERRKQMAQQETR